MDAQFATISRQEKVRAQKNLLISHKQIVDDSVNLGHSDFRWFPEVYPRDEKGIRCGP